ncbi:PrsW family intramembrane metalloprotease [Mesorhizobium sp. M2A.F.Ca.ET.042.01.1.1]|nr:PrsW family intramembrane metalloprotease [Mesorhizobium sp. M2A.F.Ca.ET.042.01.1.1]
MQLVPQLFAKRQIRGPWNGLVYGVLVGSGFGFTKDLVNLISSVDDITDLVSAYLAGAVFMAHLHPMLTALTGLAPLFDAASQIVPAKPPLQWPPPRLRCGGVG